MLHMTNTTNLSENTPTGFPSIEVTTCTACIGGHVQGRHGQVICLACNGAGYRITPARVA